MIHCFNKNDKAIQNIITKRGEAFLAKLGSDYAQGLITDPLYLGLVEHYKDREKALSAYIDSYKDEFEAQYDPKTLDRTGRPPTEVVVHLVDASKSENKEDKERTRVMAGVAPSISQVITTRLSSFPVTIRKVGGSLAVAVHDLINPIKEFAHTIVALNTYNTTRQELRSYARLLEGSKVVREDVADVSEEYNLAKYIGDAIAAGDNVFAKDTVQYRDWNKLRNSFIQKAAYDLAMDKDALTTLSTEYVSDIANDFDTQGTQINSFRLSITPDKDISALVLKLVRKFQSKHDKTFRKFMQSYIGDLAPDSKFSKSHKKAAEILRSLEDKYDVREYPSKIIYVTSKLLSHSAGTNRAIADTLSAARLTGKTPPLDDFLRLKNTLPVYDFVNSLEEMMAESSEIRELFTEAGLPQKINSIRANKNAIEHSISEIAKMRVVEEYAPHLIRVEAKHRAGVEKDIKSQNKDISKEDLEVMVDAQMEKDKAIILSKQKDALAKMTDFVLFDINGAEALFLDPRSINNDFLQIFTERLDLADRNTRLQTIEINNEVADSFKKMKEDNPSKTVTELFDPMMERTIKVGENGELLFDNNGDLIYTNEYSGHYVAQEQSQLRLRFNRLKSAENDILDTPLDLGSPADVVRELKVIADKVNGEWILKPKYYSKQHANLINRKDSTTEMYNTLLSVNSLADASLPSYFKLGTKIPSIERSAKQASQDSGILEASRDEIDNYWNVKNSDELQLEHSTDPLTGGSIPLFFRNKVEPSKLSHDLATSAILNYNTSRNYANKNALRAESAFLLDILGNAKVGEKASFSKHKMKLDRSGAPRPITSRDEAEVDEYVIEKDGALLAYKIFSKSGKESNIYKAMKAQIEQRVYGLTSKSSPEITKRVSKLTSSVSKIYLMGNLPGATKNFIMGNISNFLMSVNSKHVNSASVAKANAQYALNYHNYIDDMGRLRPKSLHGQLFERLNVFQGFKAIDGTNYADRDILSKAYGYEYANFLYSVGEHQITSTLALSVLNSYKVENADGKKVSVLDAYELDKNGKLAVKEGFKVNDKTEFEVERIIENARRVAQGNYSSLNRAMAEQYIIGKLGMQMRKFLPSGVQSRFRGISNVIRKETIAIDDELGFYNMATNEFEEGSYTSAARLIRGWTGDLIKLRFDLVTGRYAELTDNQKRNVWRAFAEGTIIMVAAIGAAALRKLAVDEDDEETRAKLFFITYMAAGIKSELLFYLNPAEATKLMKSPGVALPVIDNILRLTKQLLTAPTETFKTGRNFEENKALYYLQNSLPLRYGIPGIYEGPKSQEESTQALFKN